MWQTLLIVFLIGGVLIYLVRYFAAMFSGDGSSCACSGCAGCSGAAETGPPPEACSGKLGEGDSGTGKLDDRSAP